MLAPELFQIQNTSTSLKQSWWCSLGKKSSADCLTRPCYPFHSDFPAPPVALNVFPFCLGSKLQPWRQTQDASAKRWPLQISPHGDVTQKHIIRNIIALRILNLTFLWPDWTDAIRAGTHNSGHSTHWSVTYPVDYEEKLYLKESVCHLT
jgi:hypothetical protein